VLNYAPARAEAYYRRVPLVAVSADRPFDAIDQRDSQTIRQSHALDAVVRRSVDIADDASPRYLRYARRLINDAVSEAVGPLPGPVHINMQFDVPLTPMAEVAPIACSGRIDVCRPARSDFGGVIDSIDNDARILIVLGDMPFDVRMRRILGHLAESGAVAFHAEAQSNAPASCRIGRKSSYETLPAPDVVLSAGGSLVSAKVKAFLRAHPESRHISIGYDDSAVDTFGSLDTVVHCCPADFFEALAASGKGCRDFAGTWSKVPDDRQGSAVVQVLQTIVSAFPDGVFHFSNGSSVRYAQLLDFGDDNRVESNRGCSGIEGATSTAIGDAMSSASRHLVLVTGDMSAAYDIGALAVHGIPDTFRMVVLDNCGGDIFRAVATTRELPERETLFATPPQLPLKALAEAYGCRYFDGDTDGFVGCGSRAILHLHVPPGDCVNVM
ncbi:MAG: hypothetical protein K2J38_02150, partial [Muribaculaceae bacterium]|nr:hypothetical protein [Muribaculaceae bacterium]